MNQELYTKMLNLGNVILYKENCRKQIKTYEKTITDAKAHVERKKEIINENPEGYGAIKGWSIFFYVAAACLLPICLLGLVTSLRFLTVLGAISLVMMLVGGISLTILAKKAKEKHVIKATAEYEADLKKLEETNILVNDSINKINELLKTYDKENKEILDCLPKKYHTASAVNFMVRVVCDLRADSIKEAINLYEEELHFVKLEKILEDSVRIQNYNTKRINDIKIEQERANAELKKIKAMQIVDMVVD